MALRSFSASPCKHVIPGMRKLSHASNIAQVSGEISPPAGELTGIVGSATANGRLSVNSDKLQFVVTGAIRCF